MVVLGFASYSLATAGAMNLFTNPSFENGSGAVAFSPTTGFRGGDLVCSDQHLFRNSGMDLGAERAGRCRVDRGHWERVCRQRRHSPPLLGHDPVDPMAGCGRRVGGGRDLPVRLQFCDLGARSGSGRGRSEFGQRARSCWSTTTGTPPTISCSEISRRDIRPPENLDNGPGALTWLSDSQLLVIPADYGSEFNFQINTSGTGMLMDNLALTRIPEPSAAGLCAIAAGLLGLRGRQRR